MSELRQAISEMRNMRESYDDLVSQNAQLAADVQAIKDAHILGFSYDGLIFEEGYEPQSAFGIVLNRAKLIEVHDDRNDVIPEISASAFPLLEVFEMKSATSAWRADMFNFFLNNSVIREVRIPSMSPMMNVADFCRNCANLRLVDISYFNVNNFRNNPYSFSNSLKLIDIIAGRLFSGSRDLFKYWSPTDALLDNSISLLTQADIDAGLTSNREKLLYNIREHIAANLPNRIGDTPFVITFSQTLRDAFDQATDDAFAAKNWDIAPIRS